MHDDKVDKHDKKELFYRLQRYFDAIENNTVDEYHKQRGR